MIYLVTNQKKLYKENCYTIISVKESIHLLKSLDIIGVDTETTGLSPLTDTILTLQLGCKEFQVIVDCTTIDINNYKEILEDNLRLKILCNAKFDIRFLLKRGIIINNVWDVFLADLVLYNYSDHPWQSLYNLVKKYCNYELDKTNRQYIHKEGLTNRVLIYCAEDVEYLEDVYLYQLEEALKDRCTIAIDIENKYVIALSYMENCGIYLDADKWTKVYKKNLKKAKVSLDKLNEWIINNLPQYINPQMDLFEPEKRSININWASSKQVIPIFETLGLDILVADKETGLMKKSIEAPVIKKYEKDYPFVKLYLEYKATEKAITTYGIDFLNHINKITGRVHSEYIQLQDTSRMSSKNPNLQNLPTTEDDEEQIFRACFTAQSKNNILVNADYSGQEQIILANTCLEPNLLEFYNSGRTDMHSFVAKLCFPGELNDLEEKEVKKSRPDLRYLAKTAGFSINYGGNGDTIAKNANVSKAVGDSAYKAYFKAFPELKKYFDRVGSEAIKRGYILISGKTGRRYYFSFMDEYNEANFAIHEEGFWDDYKDSPVKKEIVKKFYTYKGEMQRKAQNYPVQGCSAEVTKIAQVHLFKWIVENNYFNEVLLVNAVHDEILLECPKELSKMVAENLKRCMENAGNYYCKTIELKAVPVITPIWAH